MNEPSAPEEQVAPPPSQPGPAAPPRPAPQQSQSWQSTVQPFDPGYKSPRLAAVLSALAPGIGQIYVGYYVRGFSLIASLIVLIALANNVPGDIAPAFGFGSAFLWAFVVVDAGRIAALYNHAAAGAGSIEMPTEIQMPAAGGSLAGGGLLLLFGLIALSNTAFGVRLDWLDAWWPIFPMALGGYLLARGILDRNR